MVDKYLPPGHAERLATAMNNFHEALTRRWREVVTEAIVNDHYDYPRVIRRSVSPHSHQPLWDYRSLPARHHINGGHCAYVAWVEGGQNGSLASVACGGDTGIRDDDIELFDQDRGEMVLMPKVIECGVGSILAQVEDWAWGERDHIFYKLPMFDNHDVGAIKQAHRAFIRAGTELALQKEDADEDDDTFTPISDREMASTVESLSGRGGVGAHWWTGWTGLMADRAKSGFFASTVPTINNQSGILGCLAGLYSDRAAIIAMGRNNGLRWVDWATEKLGRKEVVTTDLTEMWTAVQGVGLTVSTYGAFTGPGAAVAAPVGMVLLLGGFLGKNYLPDPKSEQYAATIEEVVGGLNDEIGNLSSDLDTAEFQYRAAVSQLRSTIFGIHSYNLELYDLTQNCAGGDQLGVGESNHGYEANIDVIMEIAQKCYDLSGHYEIQMSTVADTSEADPHLADSDGRPTDGDTMLLEIRDMLHGFLKTTVGRYLLAGDQTKEAAEAYVEVDTSQQGAFEAVFARWEQHDDVGRPDINYDPDSYADETDRGDYDPYEGHPALGGQDPGSGDGTTYVTEGDEDYTPNPAGAGG